MAGLDRKGQSDFIRMLCKMRVLDQDYATLSDPVRLLTDVLKTTQMVTDSLLLHDATNPLSEQPFYASTNVVLIHAKKIHVMADDIESFTSSVSGAGSSDDFSALCELLAELAHSICLVAEGTAQALVMMGQHTAGSVPPEPDLVNYYVITRGRLAVELAMDVFAQREFFFNSENTSLLSISAIVAAQLEAVQDACLEGLEQLEQLKADDELSDTQRAKLEAKPQLQACLRAVGGVVSAFVEAMKRFVTESSLERFGVVKAFATPVVATFTALETLLHSDKAYLGSRPRLREDVRNYADKLKSRALQVMTAASLFLKAVKHSLTATDSRQSADTVARYEHSLKTELDVLTECVATIQRRRVVSVIAADTESAREARTMNAMPSAALPPRDYSKAPPQTGNDNSDGSDDENEDGE